MIGWMSPELRREYLRAKAHVQWVYFTRPLLVLTLVGLLISASWVLFGLLEAWSVVEGIGHL